MIPFERAIGECCKEMMFVVNAKHMNALFRRSARFVNGTADGMCVCMCMSGWMHSGRSLKGLMPLFMPCITLSTKVSF